MGVLQDLIIRRRLGNTWAAKSALSLILFLLAYTIQAQTRITGTVADKKGQPLEGITVTVVARENNTTLAFAISDADGAFATTLNSPLDSVKIVARALSYGEQSFVIPNKSQSVYFQLQPQQIELKEVSVRANPITRSNDTISYSVAAFTDKKDRAIADVLRKLPGIEVESSGRILYEGKPIQKFYIEGLDLLEGKYNLASNNLPADAVTSIQVLENHQPIRILDSLVASYSTSLNIRLKNRVTTTGRAKVGAGYAPVRWDANLTPMLFTKKQQLIASYQANNTGDDVAADLKTLTIDELLEQAESNTEKQDFLRIQELSPPRFSSNRYLFNNIHILSTNYLMKLKRDVQLRINASYLNDYQIQEGETQSIFYFPDDTVRLRETKNNKLFFNSAQTNLTLLKNTKGNYIKNSLQFNGYRDSQRGSIDTQQGRLIQQLDNPYYALSNNLEVIQPVGKQLVAFSSSLSYNRAPQSLKVNPGQFEELLNSGMPYDELEQQINLVSFYTNNSASITKGIKRWTFTSKLGFLVQRQKLASDLIKAQSRNEADKQSIFQNNLDWEQNRYYGQADVVYKTERWNITAKLPLSFRSFAAADKPLNKKQGFTRPTFEPNVFAMYNISPLWRARASFRLANQFGRIDQVNYAYILKDYRNLQLNASPLQETVSQNYSLGLSYKNSLKSFFSNLSYSFNTTESNLTYQNNLQENGALIVTALDYPSKALSHSMGLQASKYFSELRTTFGIGTNLYINQRQQVLGDNLTKVRSRYLLANLKVNTRLLEWLSFDYKSTFSTLRNTIGKDEPEHINVQDHNVSLNIYPAENQYVGLMSDYYYNSFAQTGSKSLFADIVYRYTMKDKKIDFELRWANVFNTSKFTNIYTDSFTIIENTYTLRPSQLLFSVRFSL